MPELTSIQVGDYCFRKTEEIKLIGLQALERVLIGEDSFTKCPYNPNRDGMNPNRHFYLKDCERLKELKIGIYSFADYSVCEIENVPSLEVIEMGKLKEENWSNNFFYASLELKSDDDEMK